MDKLKLYAFSAQKWRSSLQLIAICSCELIFNGLGANCFFTTKCFTFRNQTPVAKKIKQNIDSLKNTRSLSVQLQSSKEIHRRNWDTKTISVH